MSAKWIVCIVAMVTLASCGEYEQLERQKELKRTADSIYVSQRDSLRIQFDSLCDKQYTVYYQQALDSLKQKQIKEIRHLFE